MKDLPASFYPFLYSSTEDESLARHPSSPLPEGLSFGKDTRESASRNTELPKIRISSGFLVVSMLSMATENTHWPSRTSRPTSVLSLDFGSFRTNHKRCVRSSHSEIFKLWIVWNNVYVSSWSFVILRFVVLCQFSCRCAIFRIQLKFIFSCFQKIFFGFAFVEGSAPFVLWVVFAVGFSHGPNLGSSPRLIRIYLSICRNRSLVKNLGDGNFSFKVFYPILCRI